MKITFVLFLAFTIIQAQQPNLNELMRGAQTGMFIQNEESLQYYNCANATMTPQAEAFSELVYAVKKFALTLDPDDKELQDLECEECDANLQKLALVVSVMISYDGDEFCQGLTLAYNLRSMLVQFLRFIKETAHVQD